MGVPVAGSNTVLVLFATGGSGEQRVEVRGQSRWEPMVNTLRQAALRGEIGPTLLTARPSPAATSSNTTPI